MCSGSRSFSSLKLTWIDPCVNFPPWHTHTERTAWRHFGKRKAWLQHFILDDILTCHTDIWRSQQTEADICPPLWGKHLTNERSCTITGRLWSCPRWWNPPLEEGHQKQPTAAEACPHLHTYKHAHTPDRCGEDINRYTDSKGKTARPPQPHFQSQSPPPMKKYEDIILWWL